MIADAFLRFTDEEGQRPSIVGASSTILQPSPFPLGYLGNPAPKTIDLRDIDDLGAGRTNLRARFTVTENFGVVAGTSWRAVFCVIVGNDATLSAGAKVLVQSGPNDGSSVGYQHTALQAGVMEELVIPRLSSFARSGQDGFRWLGLGMAIKHDVGEGANAGLVRAQLVLDGIPEQFGNPRYHTSGFTVKS